MSALGRGVVEGAGSLSWENLRKQARKLENTLDSKLSSFRGASATLGEDQVEKNEAEIEELLQQLQHVNKNMQTVVSSAGSEVLSHTLARHGDILHELSQEFRRIRSSARASRQHAQLLETFTHHSEKTNLDGNGEPLHQAMLREHASVHRATGQMDSVINQAQAAFNVLTFQRSVFGDINSKIKTVGARLPSVRLVSAP
ncbi:hypothetical protein O6H91_05G107000 [Diphasiastrum complanatum]|uniref:Uncharacterized protein n=1 Tax=Diphasiastrum complanatum TaxID=34168 RepID=A0ACC2DRS7_DIPCM|nr:hypothetical protein O6H91_05G107000 [Diphasiastrum complanatum]